MTKEEKKNVLHCLKVMVEEENCEECDLYGTTGTDHCEKDCVRMAIESLEQEPCEDAVSREAVIEATHHCGDLQEVRAVVRELPPVTPSINTEKLKTINKYCYEYGRQDGRNECRRKGYWIEEVNGK